MDKRKKDNGRIVHPKYKEFLQIAETMGYKPGWAYYRFVEWESGQSARTILAGSIVEKSNIKKKKRRKKRGRKNRHGKLAK